MNKENSVQGILRRNLGKYYTQTENFTTPDKSD